LRFCEMSSSYIPTTELNMRCAGVKRLLKEAVELRGATELFYAKPMEDNLFEWHFTVRGPPDTPYQGGVYHGRIILPPEYPMKPPNLILLTPNGRWAEGQKICLSISGYHPETWLPSWSIRTALLALVGFMPTPSVGAIGGIDCSDDERRRLAIKSLDWRCEACSCCMRDIPLKEFDASASPAILQEVQSAAKQPQTTSTIPPTSGNGPVQANEATPISPEKTPKDKASTSPSNTVPTAPTATQTSTVQQCLPPSRSLDPTLMAIVAIFIALLILLTRRFLL